VEHTVRGDEHGHLGEIARAGRDEKLAICNGVAIRQKLDKMIDGDVARNREPRGNARVKERGGNKGSGGHGECHPKCRNLRER
jgi:hypothetical protein